MQAKTIRAPQFRRDRLQSISLEFDHFRTRVVLGRHEQQIVRAPDWHSHGNRVIGLEWHLPLQVAVVRIDADDGAIHYQRELLETADVDQYRRRIHVTEVVLAPCDGAIQLAERHHRFSRPAYRHNHRVAKRDWTRSVAVHHSRTVMIAPELLRPEKLPRRLFDALETSGNSGGEQAIADNERGRVR